MDRHKRYKLARAKEGRCISCGRIRDREDRVRCAHCRYNCSAFARRMRGLGLKRDGCSTDLSATTLFMKQIREKAEKDVIGFRQVNIAFNRILIEYDGRIHKTTVPALTEHIIGILAIRNWDYGIPQLAQKFFDKHPRLINGYERRLMSVGIAIHDRSKHDPHSARIQSPQVDAKGNGTSGGNRGKV